MSTVHEPIRIVRSRTIVLNDAHIDTDRIIPARFLTTTKSEGLGERAFFDWRRHRDGSPRVDCPLNDPRADGAAVIVAGRNFGCGSSREHAVWALRDIGIRVVIAPEIADIFRANASRNGILPVVLSEPAVAVLAAHPFVEIEIDLESCEVTAPFIEPTQFTIDPFARRCLLEGVDELEYLLNQLSRADAFDSNSNEKEPCTH